MKKVLFYLCLAAGLVSCAKEMAPVEDAPAGVPVTFNVTVSNGPGTKAAKTDWATGDVIYVFFQNIGEKYLALTYNGSGWDESCPAGDLLDTDFAGVSDYKLAAVHLPIPVEVGWSNFDNSFSFYRGESYVNSYYLFESQKAYTVDGTTVTATLSLAKPEKVALFHIPGIQDNLSDYIFYCQQVARPDCWVLISNASVGQGSTATSSGNLVGYADADGAIFAVTLSKTEAKDYTFTLEGPHRTYTLARKAKVLEGGKMYEFPALDDPEWSVEDDPGFLNDHAYVDMGNGLKWATMNLGATKPSGDGDYYAWAVTEPTAGFTWGSYKWASIPAGVVDSDGWRYLTKYTYDDGETSAIWYDAEENYIGNNDVGYSSHDYEDDAARQVWGATWRTPSAWDWDWLINNCTWTWVDNYEGTSASGMLVTSTVDGFTDRSIFLPAAQHPQSTRFAGGDYWTSDLDDSWNSSAAIFLHFAYDDFGGSKRIMNAPRNELLVIRPVSD